jgi:hypothetical protein
MNLSFEQAIIEVWRQALLESAKAVELGKQHFPSKQPEFRAILVLLQSCSKNLWQPATRAVAPVPIP